MRWLEHSSNVREVSTKRVGQRVKCGIDRVMLTMINILHPSFAVLPREDQRAYSDRSEVTKRSMSVAGGRRPKARTEVGHNSTNPYLPTNFGAVPYVIFGRLSFGAMSLLRRPRATSIKCTTFQGTLRRLPRRLLGWLPVTLFRKGCEGTPSQTSHS